MELQSQLRSSILTASLPPPSSSFLTTLIQARNPPLPLPSLLATARSRLLTCDLTSNNIIDASLAALPADLANPAVKELRLSRDVHVQVLDVENLSVSRWNQVEEIEAIERGEKTRGREVIRIIEDSQDDGHHQPARQTPGSAVPPAGKNATHKLVLQDCQGQKVFALELRRVSSIGVGSTMMGEKILLKAGTVVARGVVMLTPDNCLLLGGKIDSWQKAWTDGRLARLKESTSAVASS
jgi:RecQ-mediated genome instability protein 1